MIIFRMHVMFQYIFHLDRTESTKAHMKSDTGDLHAAVLNFFQQLLCKMQSGCRRCRRALVLCLNGLITVFILKLMGNVGRQRHLTKLIQNLLKNTVIGKLDQTVSLIYNIQHRSL